MTSPMTRSQRPRRAAATKNLDNPDSSPSSSRPAKRRKKEIDLAQKLVPNELPRDQAGLQMDEEELVTQVATHLTMPPNFVQASQDHANSLHEMHSKAGVQAYAKLAGKDWTFYVKSLRNVIGRPPENLPAEQQTSDNVNGESHSAVEETKVHIDLGPSKMISRQHAEVYYDSTTASWTIVVFGRNGIRINNELVRKNDRHALISGQVIDISGVEMMFVLPEEHGRLKIHKRYLQRAGLIQSDGNATTGEEETSSSPPGIQSSQYNPSDKSGLPGPLPIAPAPPDYRRPGTPLSARAKSSTGKSPAYANGGTILMNADDIDLSLDSNRHIKPNYSYAQMITQAILNTENEKLNLNGIYNFIMDKYAYYRHQDGGGWQNSIRHNLSLNKSFEKRPRSTDEPGKGMKWCIVAEAREEMVRNSNRGGRGGHRGSSMPNSPGAGNLNRMQNQLPSSAMKQSPQAGSPPASSFPTNDPQFTPDRKRSLQEQAPDDGSPLPRHRRANNNSLGLSDNISGSPPALSSSYMQDDGVTMVTPAPHRVHPRLAPPSTAQRPSQHMPTSSPAPFWKFAELGNTPKTPSFDASPTKVAHVGRGIPESSSPPAVCASPTRNGTTPLKRELAAPIEELDEEDQGFDLTKGFQSIGAYHAPASIAGAVHAHS